MGWSTQCVTIHIVALAIGPPFAGVLVQLATRLWHNRPLVVIQVVNSTVFFNAVPEPVLPSAAWSDDCKREAAAAPWNTPRRRIAVVLRGEAFRSGPFNEKLLANFSENVHMWRGKQYGVYKRLTCSAGSYELQTVAARNHLELVAHFEQLGYMVHVFGLTYPCVAATARTAGFVVEDALPRVYEGRIRILRMLNKSTSQQITGIREGMRLVGEQAREAGMAYEYVIMIRFDQRFAPRRWSCFLAGSASPILGDLRTLEGVGNDDLLFVIPRVYIPCFIAFTQQTDAYPETCCYGYCGGGACQRCLRNFMNATYQIKYERVFRKEFCHGRRQAFLGVASGADEQLGPRKLDEASIQEHMIGSFVLGGRGLEANRLAPLSSPDWLPDADKLCINRTNSHPIRQWRTMPVGPGNHN